MQAIKDFFLSGGAIFNVDKNRYAQYNDGFEQQLDDLELQLFQADRARLRGDLLNILRDFKKAKETYKKERVHSHGKNQ